MPLIDRYGREMRTDQPITDEIAVGSVRDLYSTYPSTGLTPQGLAGVFSDADRGSVLRQSELFEEMEEKDAHLGSVLQTRKLAVAGLDWTVEPPADSGARGEDVAAFVRGVLRSVTFPADDYGYDLTDWQGVMLGLLDAVGKGFSVSEIVWDISDGQAIPAAIRWRHPKLFTFYDPVRRLYVPRLITEDAPVEGEPLPPGKFLYYRSRTRAGSPARGGVLRPCAWSYLFKHYTLKDWVVFAERYAQPMRVGKYNQGATEAERDVLWKAVRYLGTDAAAVISEGTQIELIESKQKGDSSKVYDVLAQYSDRAISKAVLGHAGSVDSTPGRLGGEDEARDVRRDLIEADALALAPVINRQLIHWLTVYNFGADAPVPSFAFHVGDKEDLGRLSETVERLTGAGVATIPVRWVHEKFGIPQPEEGEETVTPGGDGFLSELAAKEARGCGCSAGHKPSIDPPPRQKGMGGGVPGPPDNVELRRMVLADRETDGWEARYLREGAEYAGRAADAAADAVHEAVGERMGGWTDAEDFALWAADICDRAVQGQDRSGIRALVKRMYAGLYQGGEAFAAAEGSPEVDIAFGGADVRTAEHLAGLDDYHMSKYLGNPDATATLQESLREQYAEGGEGLFGRGDTDAVNELTSALRESVEKISRTQVERIVETSVQRTRNWANAQSLYDAGVTETKVFEPTRECPFCQSMHGRVISTQAAWQNVQSMTGLSPDQFAEQYRRLPAIEGNEDAYQSMGAVPPYHPHCRGRQIKAVR